MKFTKYTFCIAVLLFTISCKKNNENNPAAIASSKCLVSNTLGLNLTNYNYDENNRIKQFLRLNLTENFDDLLKFDYASNTCYVKSYDVNHGNEDITLTKTDILTLNADGACIQYKNRHIYYNSNSKLLDSLVEFNISTNKPEYVTYYVYDNKKQLIEKNTYYYYGAIKITTQTIKIEYDNNVTKNAIPLTAGDPLFGNSYDYGSFIRIYPLSLLLSHQFLGKNYPVNGIPIKESKQLYSLGDPFGLPSVTNYNYRRNSSNQIDSIWQTNLDGFKVEFVCK